MDSLNNLQISNLIELDYLVLDEVDRLIGTLGELIF